MMIRSTVILLFIACNGPLLAQVSEELKTTLKHNDSVGIEQWLREGGDINAQDEKGATVLMWAYYLSELSTIRLLIEKGAKVENPKGVLSIGDSPRLRKEYGNLQYLAVHRATCEEFELLKFTVLELGLSLYDPSFDSRTQTFSGPPAIGYYNSRRRDFQRQYARRRGPHLSTCPLMDLQTVFGDDVMRGLHGHEKKMQEISKKAKEAVYKKYRWVYNELVGDYGSDNYDRSLQFERNHQIDQYRLQVGREMSQLDSQSPNCNQLGSLYRSVSAYKGVKYELDRLIKSAMEEGRKQDQRMVLMDDKLREVKEKIYEELLSESDLATLDLKNGQFYRYRPESQFDGYLDWKAKEEFILAEVLASNPMLSGKTLSQQTAAVTTFFAVDWRDIQRNLAPEDALLDFFTFPKGQQKHFGAFLIKKNSPCPSFFDLGTVETLYQSDLESAQQGGDQLARGRPGGSDAQLFDFKMLYRLIWAPLAKELNGSQRVFYSLDDNLFAFPFAAFTDDSSKVLCQKFDLIQLYSTRTMVKGPFEPTTLEDVKDAVLLGGVDFSGKSKETPKAYFGNNKSIFENKLADFPFLQGSAKETDFIAQLFNAEKGYQTKKITGANATEEQLEKVLAAVAERPNIIHAATHGYFLGVKGYEFFGLDKSLIRSALLVAGQSPTESRLDGIWTAYEIANCYLGNTRLMVLSACSSGQGSTMPGEGPIGLSRAAKTAGVGNVLVSLDKVGDQVALEYMQQFYTYLSQGENIHAAYRKTQLALLERYPADPSRWAIFTLVE